MKRYFQIGLCLLGIWLLWLLFAFVTFVEMEVLLAYLGAIYGALFFAAYFLIGYLLSRSKRRKELVRMLLLILGALLVAGAGRYAYFLYETAHPGKKIDFSTAQEFQTGKINFAPGEQRRYTMKASEDGVLKLEMKFATEEELYLIYSTWYDESGKEIGKFSRGPLSVFVELDLKTGETYYLQLQNADALNSRTVEIQKNRP